MENQIENKEKISMPKKRLFSNKIVVILVAAMLSTLLAASIVGGFFTLRDSLKNDENSTAKDTTDDFPSESGTQSTQSENPRGTQEGRQLTLTENGYTLNLSYTDANTWNYELTGDLPTPCHKANVETIVRESFPEQVTVTLAITRPTGMCIQVLEPITLTGTIEVSEQAEFDFIVS
ncbi:MAG: hypothetical protein ACOCXT_05910 [Candidatus Dojkabacteria bacterium]